MVWGWGLAGRVTTVCLTVITLAFMQQGTTAHAQDRPAEKRLALVIGNSAYQYAPELANPRNDAKDMARELEAVGFRVILAVDATKAQMDSALRAFADKLSQADVALLFYAGHGLQVGSQNYLVPIDAHLNRERDLAFEAVSLEFMLRQMEIDRENKTTLVMLDACRDNPLTRNLARSMGTRSTAIGQGLAATSAGVGTFIAYSTQPGNVALDGKGRNSPFTTALLHNIGKSGRNINTTMIEVRKAVIQETGGAQVPWDHSALTGDFYFVPAKLPRAGTTIAAPASKGDDVAALKARLKALEEAEARRREGDDSGRTTAGKTAALSPTERANIIELAEAKAKYSVAFDKGTALQRELFEARRTELQTNDKSQRMERMRKSVNIQRAMTTAFLEAKHLKNRIAELEAALTSQSPTNGFDLDMKPKNSRAGFDVYEGAAMSGTKIKFASADTIAGCVNVCHNTQGCIAGEFDSTGSRQTSCSVYSHVVRLKRAGKTTSAFVKPARLSTLPPVQPQTVPGSTVAFEKAENVRIEGTPLAPAFRTSGPDACANACGANPRCVAYQHGRKIPVMGLCQLFTSIESRHEDRSWRSGARVSNASASSSSPSTGAPQGQCHPMSISFKDPIPLYEGMKLCNGIGLHLAQVQSITDLGVVFSVPEAQDFTCRAGTVCQFQWPGSPSPHFRVVIKASNAIAPATATMTPR
ncbi:MAG: caspase domain-containing protein [Hyphomicrobiaceae bacterium]